MFTVIAAEKNHIDSINEFGIYLEPVLRNKGITFCEWNTNGETLEDAVPDLKDVVERFEEWRLVVLLDGKTKEQKNPFNVIPYEEPECKAALRDEAWYEEVRKRRFAAYEKAAKEPFVKLMTWLCQGPLTTGGRLNYGAEDPAFKLYQDSLQRKKELRQEIIGGHEMDIPYPKEVLCFALRTYKKTEYDIHVAWSEAEENCYSRFYDWNMYFDKMRYLLYDIHPEGHKHYAADYLRFALTMLTVAGNDIPGDCLKANRVYSLSGEEDIESLSFLLTEYDNKLLNTQAMLKNRLSAMKDVQGKKLSNSQAESMFCTNISVPVTFDGDVDRDGLYADKRQIGLSSDCPGDETGFWESELSRSGKTVTAILKQEKRGVHRSVGIMHEYNVPSTVDALSLSDFQVEDVAEHTEKEVIRMVSNKAENMQDRRQLDRDMKEIDGEIRDEIETRMTKGATVALGVVLVFLSALGAVPFLVRSLKNAEREIYSIVFIAGIGAVAAIAAFICLFFLRMPLKNLITKFNNRMKRFDKSVEDAMSRTSVYLSNVCNAMRGYYILDYCKKYRNSETRTEKLYNKHISDIAGYREELRTVFGKYLPDYTACKADESPSADVYDFDFTRAVDYKYAMPFPEGGKGSIDFMEPGNKITIPAKYIRGIYVEREELYDGNHS